MFIIKFHFAQFLIPAITESNKNIVLGGYKLNETPYCSFPKIK